MPGQVQRFKPRKKNNKKKPRYGFIQAHRSPQFSQGFPSRQFVKLVYQDYLTGTSSGGTFVSGTYGLNSLYDPDSAIGGHQPYYFDQLSTIYARYRVLKCKIDIDGSVDKMCLVSMKGWPSNYSISLNTAELLEQPRNTNKIVNEDNKFHISRTFQCNEVEGITKTMYENDIDFQAGIGGNPTRLIQASVSFIHPDGSTAVAVEAVVRLTYYGVMSTARNPGLS